MNRDRSIQLSLEWVKIRSDGYGNFRFLVEGRTRKRWHLCQRRGEARLARFAVAVRLTSSRGSFRDVTNVTVAPLPRMKNQYYTFVLLGPGNERSNPSTITFCQILANDKISVKQR